ncbi:amino acid ABC transporter ATP-binding protein (PAAT family) [Azorhizobium sp. AG788]|uniref:amino acid ABC transporter ATP-binding protein n=1 Tax=Azorhizobium sp. AG788 TaxID=2183897 RepID=UPI00105E7C6A|nr:amino acid ABC transporter ATP-binding protein [Azorhizobium sp. AG788]TDT88797.1 amino acid ABC transporter ATP-binding protein (PAAT family) [Azorhizobium sp. AG788]
MQPIVQASDVRKHFDTHCVLDGVSLAALEGQLISLIGPAGCGKSTLLRCLNGLDVPDSGTIEIGGVTWARAAGGRAPAPEVAHELRRTVAMVFQGDSLFPHRTLLQNVMMAPMMVLGVSRDEAAMGAELLLRKVGLFAEMDRYPAHLSAGQQQRGAIARALAMSPKVMLYDEPTSALDGGMAQEVLDTIALLKDDGLTQIIATHELGFARAASDSVMFMQNGAVVETAPGDAMFRAPQDVRVQRFFQLFA